MNITSKTIKENLKSNGYTCQKLGFDNRRPFNLGLHSQNEQKTDNSPFKMADSEYYYKIGGKTVTKAQYNAYENPVGDGPTKSTNDPDASGNKAKIQKNRSTNKASKRPTALTKEQTKLKGQGTKITKKPPFKQKLNGKKLPKGYTKKDAKFLKEQREDVVRYEDLDAKGQAIWKKQGKPVPKKPPFKQKDDFKPHMMHKKGEKSVKANTYAKHLSLKKKGYGHSPLKNKWLDYAQTGLTAVGMIPGFGNAADGVNAAISGGRAGYAKMTGDKAGAKKYAKDLAVNLAAMVPGAGLAVGATKLASKSAKTAKALKTANNLKKAKETVVKGKKVRDKVKMAANATDSVINSQQLNKDVKDKKYITPNNGYTINNKAKGSKKYA